MTNKLFFGTAGIPISTRERTTINGIKRVRKIGLGAMELEFVHSVNLNEEKAKEVFSVAKKEEVVLTCHGQYYINLASMEKEKQNSSVKRILNAANIANFAGASSLTFHAGFYQKQKPLEVYKTIKTKLEEIVSELKSKNNPIVIRPETTGKATQFGSLEELLQLSSELEQVLPCIDFAHLHARAGGKENSYNEFHKTLEKSEKLLGKEFLKNLHCHVAGIAYSEKGERNHLELKDSDFKYKELMQALKDFDCEGIIICESPNIEDDALLLKKTFEKLN